MNNFKKPIFQILLLIGALILALALRLIRLGVLPLTNMEAGIALQALAVGQGVDTVFGEHIAYVGLTGLDFFIFEAGNFLARFWPAIIGAMVVLIPFLFKDVIGDWAAGILGIVLAVTPEMVSLSRIIGAPMIAFVSLFLAFGLIYKRKPVLSGVAFAFALMGGSGFWTGILLTGIGFVLGEVFLDFGILSKLKKRFSKRKFRFRFFTAWILTIGVVGTGFFLSPEGLSGVFSGLVNFIRGFDASYTRPFLLRPLALIAYSLPAVLFGIWGGIRSILHNNKLDLFLSILAMLGLLYLLVYPGAQPADIIWVTLPLWALSARVICSVWRLPEDNQLVMTGTALVVVIVFAFLLLSLRSIINPGFVQDAQIVTLVALFGGFILLIALILLVTYGWSEDVAISGLLIGLSFVALFGMTAVTNRSTGLSTEEPAALWYPDDPQLTIRWLKTSIDRVFEWNKRRSEPLEIVVVDLSTPGMQWALQEYEDTAFVLFLPPASQPGILISDIMTQPEISNSYRGQELVWTQNKQWQEMSAMQFLNWLITREAPTASERIIFWVRTDLMPDEQFSQ